ncbi:MAG: PAS domain S-box protein [Paludibacter sp.]|jgi:PAS domain S-box-containing protein|nr:PAS domain S-box protein [Paludibacter sp.]
MDVNKLSGEELIMEIKKLQIANESLMSQEDDFRNLIGILPVGIAIIHEWTTIYFNPTAVQLLGAKSQGELLGRHIFDFINPDFHDQVKKNAELLASTGYVSMMHQQFVKLDGSLLDVETQAKSIRFDNTHATLVVMNDITERKTAQQQLKESEERYKALHDASFGGIVIHDKGKIIECNQGLSDITGFSYDELIGMDGLLLIAPSTRDMVMANILSGYEKAYEALGIRKDGEIYPLRLEARNVPYKGKMVRTVEFRDITESKLMLSELQKLEWLLKPRELHEEYFEPVYGDITRVNAGGLIMTALGENYLKNIVSDFMVLLETSCAVYERNGDYAMGIFSSGWCQFMDNASFELCSTSDLKSALCSGKWLCHESCWNEASKKAIETREPVDIECNGGIHLYAVPIFSENDVIGAINFGYGNPPQDMATLERLAERYKVNTDHLLQLAREYKTRPPYIIDLAKKRLAGAAELIGLIVQRNQSQQALRIAKEKAEESDRLKSAFLANMSHEIRTPMNGILGFAELLKEPELDGEQQQEYIRIIEKSGTRMLNIINNIIDISKIEAGLMQVQLQETNINDQLQFVATFFQPEAEARGIKLRVHAPLPHSAVILTTDTEKVYAVLTNLVKNAIKYSLKGTIEVGYRVLTNTEPAQLELYVKDEGIGIPADRQDAVFERFIQADIADTMARQGAGLGLSISKAYVDLLGGKLWVESKEDVGSTFYFTLPYQLSTPGENTRSVQTTVSSPSRKKLKILIVEDDEISEQLIEISLRSYVENFLKAKTGSQAIEMCKNHPDIELILMDIQLPELSGYEATRRIREFNKDVIIIAQTAYGMSNERDNALTAGCNDYISKPIKREELLRLIQNYL